MTTTPAQDVIVGTWNRLSEKDESWVDLKGPKDRYSPVDYAVARELAIPVSRVGEALVAAGKRPPMWWLG